MKKRVSLSQKVFLFFSSLTFITFILGIAVFFGLKDHRQFSEEILTVKNFELQIKDLETYRPQNTFKASPEYRFFEEKIKQAEQLVDRIEGFYDRYDPGLHDNLEKIRQQLRYYRQAYKELFERYNKDIEYYRNINEVRPSAFTRQAFGRKLVGAQYAAFETLLLLRENAYLERSMQRINEMKEMLAGLETMTDDTEIIAKARELVVAAEDIHLNYLAIIDAKSFLEDTANNFSRFAEQTVDIILRQNKKNTSRIYWTIILLIILGILFSFIFWLIATRYLQRFLSAQKKAIESIKAADYDYELRDVSRDELGELSLFMKDMAQSLKKSDQELRRSEEKYRGLVDNITSGVVLIDPDMKILAYNKKMREWFPDLAAADKQFCYQLISNAGQFEPCSSCPVLKSLDDGESHELHTQYTVGKKHCFFRIVTSPIKDATGKVTSVIELIEDITDQRLLEEEKEKLQLHQQHSQKMEAIGTLAGGIAHDFNNILTAIIGYSELIYTDMESDNKSRHELEEVLKAASRARELVRQILTFSRRAGHDRKPLRLQPIIKESLKMLRASIPTTIDIVADINPDCRPVLADPTHIHQIIMNLCTNAFHAMEEEGGTLRVALGEVEFSDNEYTRELELDPGRYVNLEVCDSGIGIDRKMLDRIFEPYFTTKTKGKGTGLGLSVVHGIVKKNDGHVTVYSEPGKGTTFHVYLPITASQPEMSQAVVQTPLQAAPDLLGGGESVLIVDDEESVVDMLRKVLESAGYNVTTSVKSDVALEIFQANPDKFDLVITDMTMPRMTGDKLAARLLNLRPDLPIILISGFSASMNDNLAKKIGIRRYMMKPINSENIIGTVRAVLQEQE